jgi:hypothetical protein
LGIQSSYYWGTDPLIKRRITIKSILTEVRIENALNLLDETFEGNPQYDQLSEAQKETLAKALLIANELTKR